jgi:hypothetical protein
MEIDAPFNLLALSLEDKREIDLDPHSGRRYLPSSSRRMRGSSAIGGITADGSEL